MENKYKNIDHEDYIHRLTIEDYPNHRHCLDCTRGLINAIVISIPIWSMVYFLIHLFL